MAIASTNWAKLDEAYTDEFGAMDADVYAIAGELWPQASSFAHDKLGDVATGQRLMFKAAAAVSRQKRNSPETIQSVSAYLWQSFKRLVLAEMKQRQQHQGADDQLESLPDTASRQLDDLILLDEILRRMDPQTRRMFNLRALGYSYQEIAGMSGKRANVLRSKFNKEIKRIRKLLNV